KTPWVRTWKTYVLPRGHCVRMIAAAARSSTPEMPIRSAAPTHGRTPSSPQRRASHVLPHTQHMTAKSSVVLVRADRSTTDKSLGDLAAFVPQQRPLPFLTPAISASRAVRPDDAMARDDERDLVRGACARHRADGVGPADGARDIGVRARRSAP